MTAAAAAPAAVVDLATINVVVGSSGDICGWKCRPDHTKCDYCCGCASISMSRSTFFLLFFLNKKRSLFISFFVVEQKLLYESSDFAAFVACHNCYTLTKIALYYALYVFVSTTNET